MRRRAAAWLLLACCGPAWAVPLADNPPLRALIDRLVQQDGFDRSQVERLLTEATYQQSIVDAITRPAEKMPWSRYRPIFLTEERINGGVAFWQQHADLLARAERELGVPAAVITAIIGVETRYGANTGRYRALDALTTLTVAGLPRSAFFGQELRELFLLGREEHIDPVTITGSYAGALGLPQFIPSSYRAYAVDFDHDGRRDLLGSPADAIGSVARFLQLHGWEHGAPVAVPARVEGDPAALVAAGIKPATTLAAMAAQGIRADGTDGEAARLAALVDLVTPAAPTEYWVGFENFFVLTRYNRSSFYAMSVFQLAEAVREAHTARLSVAPKD